MKDHNGSFWIGTLVGTAVGIAAGILFAPKSGQHLRSDINREMKDITWNVEEKLQNIIDTVSLMAGEIKENTTNMAEEAKQKIENVIEQGNALKEKRQQITKEFDSRKDKAMI